MNDNRADVGRALDLLKDALCPWVLRLLKEQYGPSDWSDIAWRALEGTKGMRSRTATGSSETEFLKLDAHKLLKLLNKIWNSDWQDRLRPQGKNYLDELYDARNIWAHQEPISTSDAYRICYTAARLLKIIDATQASQAVALADAIQQRLINEQTDNDFEQQLSDYLLFVRSRSEFVPLAGIPTRANGDIVRVHINDVYIRLRANRSAYVRQRFATDRSTDINPIEEHLGKHRQIYQVYNSTGSVEVESNTILVQSLLKEELSVVLEPVMHF